MGPVGPKVKRSGIGWKWQNGHGPSSLGLQEAETKARIGGFGGGGAAVGDMNTWVGECSAGVGSFFVPFLFSPFPSAMRAAPGTRFHHCFHRLAAGKGTEATRERKQQMTTGPPPGIHDARCRWPPRGVFPCLSQSSRFGGLENDSWSPISIRDLQWDPSGRMTLDFFPTSKTRAPVPRTPFNSGEWLGWRGIC